ncbi:MAG TPA: thioredoxin domain-containing protein [Acidimicrobiales bacterium]|nr:thioredoxin domain-containing protein [Acidimicrobiales bacterium]
MNRLAGAASLYLRQHADNPVDWWPYGDDAFAEARRRDVPVLLSIGYAACHWCHVMAHESFEDPAIAELVNRSTVPIKVDREERPDVDALYMSATQAMTGHGGWPMTVFLDHDARPFFAGTYFPPVRRHGQPGFAEILTAIDGAWTTRREDVAEQAAQLAESVRREATFASALAPRASPPGARVRLKRLVDALATRFDARDGGFSPAPKFPHATWLDAALAAYVATGRSDAREMATVTLDAMARGGLFDHVAGGFARYSVDATWSVPHFEKMLSDQALLAGTYLRAAAWLDEPSYAWVARKTLDFVRTTMRVDGGFASGIDADAEGVEGAHVVLTASSATAALDAAGLGGLAAATVARYALSDHGAVESPDPPRLSGDVDLVGTPEDELARTALRTARALGPQPAIDDKVLLEWNAMLAAVLAEAAWRLGEDAYGEEAVALVAQLRATHRVDGRWRRRSGPAAPLATSADLAWLVEALVACFEFDGDVAHLDVALGVTEDLLAGFWDGPRPTAAERDVGAGLFQSHTDATGLLVRAKDVLDGATPSGASAAAHALARLAMATSSDDVRAVAARLVALGEPLLDAEPHAAATLVAAACLLDDGVEVAVPGPPGATLDAARRAAPPFCVLAFGAGPLPLLDGRAHGLLYVCRHASCEAPVVEPTSVSAALTAAATWEADS